MELTIDLMDKYPDFASGRVTMGSLLLSQQVCQVLCPHEEVPAKNNEEYLKLCKKYTAALRVAVLCFWNESCNLWEPIAICSTQRLTWQWEDMKDLQHKSHTCSPLPPFNPTTSVNGLPCLPGSGNCLSCQILQSTEMFTRNLLGTRASELNNLSVAEFRRWMHLGDLPHELERWVDIPL